MAGKKKPISLAALYYSQAQSKRLKLNQYPVVTVSGGFAVMYCKCQRWPVGTWRLKLFTPRQKLSIDVTITGQELSNQPPVIPDDRPQPAG